MKRWLRRIIHLLIGTVVLAGLALLVVSAMLPGIVRDRIEGQLRALGVQYAAFDLPRVSLDGLSVTNARLGENAWLRARSIEFEYRAGELLDGQLQGIDVEGAEYHIRMRDGQLDFGPAPGQGAGTSVFDLPIQRITLRDSIIVLELEDQTCRIPIDVTLTRRSAGQFDLHLKAENPESFSISGMSLAATGAELNLTLDFAKQQLQVFTREKSRMWAGQIENGSGASTIEFSDVHLAFEASPLQPWARVAWGEQHRGLWVDGKLVSVQPVSFAAQGLNAGSEQLSLDVSVDGPDFKGWSLESVLKSVNTKVQLEAADLELSGMAIDMPLLFNAGAAKPGTFAIESVTWRDQAWPGAWGTLSLIDQDLTASATWPAVDGAMVNAKADIVVGSGGLQGEVRADLPLFDASGTNLIGKLVADSDDVELEGSVAASFRMPIGVGAGDTELTVVADRASLSHPDWLGSIESFSGSATFNAFAPLRSAPEQRLTIHRALVGENEILDATVIYSVERSDAIAVHHASWNMGELGKFTAEPFRFDPGRVRIATRVKGENIGLGPWLDIVSEGRIRGAGLLQGDLQLVFQPGARQFLQFGSGFLYAGDQSGWIQTEDSETIRQILAQGDAELSSSGDARLTQVKDRIVAALQDYQYSLLRFHFIPEADGLLCKVETKGQGRGPNGQEIESLTVNLHGFDSALRAALAGKSLWDLMD